MDIKIGAVFSLAQSQSDQHNDNEKDQAVNTAMETSEEEEAYFIPFDHAEIQPYFEVGESHAADESEKDRSISQESLNESTESIVSEGNDADCPPSLLMEDSMAVAPSGENGWHEDDMLPPVLERERPEVQETGASEKETPKQLVSAEVPTKRKCTRIFPCYLVLTNVRRVLQRGRRVSYRRFKRAFKECTNMCKKTYFRRRLEAGKDVFNVKSPSKQKPYQLYLEKEVEKAIPVADKSEKKATQEKKDMDFVSLLEHHDKLKAKRLKDIGKKQSVARKRRMIQYIPKDFRMKHLGVSEGSVSKEEGQDEVKLTLMMRLQNERILKQLHEKELFSLKAQIRMKRMANKRVKQIKKMDPEKSAMDIAAGTSLKGRKRKMNTKYGPDFALTKTEVNQMVTIAKLEKQMEREQKKRQDQMNCLKRRMSAKDSNKIDLVIDNAENNQVKRVKTEGVVSGSEKKVKDEGKLKVKFLSEKMKSGDKKVQRKTLKLRRKSTDMGDGILIREMPPEGQLISGILGTSDPKTPSLNKPNSSLTEIPSEAACADPYTFAKSLLRSSLLAKSEADTFAEEKNVSEIQKLLLKPKTVHMTPDMEKDKAKKLRIPENVQRLFKVKTEPVEPDTTTSVSSPSDVHSAFDTFTQTTVSSKMVNKACPQIVTVSTPQGLVKKPLTYSMISSSVIGTPTSPKKTIVLPSVVRQPAPATSAPPLLLKAGALPIPVTIKSGPNGDKVITVLVSATPTTEQSNKVQVSQSVTKSSNLSTTYYPQPLKTLGSQSILYTNFPNPSAPLAGLSTGLSTGLSCQQPEKGVSTTPSTLPGTPIPLMVNSSQKLPFTTNPSNQFVALPGMPSTLSNPVQVQSTLTSTSVTSTSLLTPPMSSVMASQSQTAKGTGVVDKCKFYLLKVDGKNILIPMNPSHSETPTAFVVSNDVAQKAAIIKTAGASAHSRVTSQQTAPLSKVAIPKLTSFPTSPKASKLLPKPTATITPTVTPGVKPLLEDDLRNETVSRLVKARAKFKAAVSSNVVSTPKEIPGFHIVREHSATVAKTVAHANGKGEEGILKPSIDDKSVGKRDDSDFSVKGFFDDIAATTASQQSPSEANQTVLETVIEKTRDIEEKEEEKEGEEGEVDEEESQEEKQQTIGVVSHQPATEEKKEKPFSEGVTQREDKLRKLKELLKEKQKAVEEMRSNRLNGPDD